MSVKSVLHKLVDDLNRSHLHDEIEQPDTESDTEKEVSDAAE